ncbi:hypothetical protein IE53DRAFT_63376 [Violaceomyces palustris]|uniref:Uncharacterized protein n=1 Tax=Violaceomyces palustris TaxID=1673888 RepID=A0ACD0NZ69_9BASI|nr:hypothetical protein IE53DRAFT_63376 [Violaceomyces palustris]
MFLFESNSTLVQSWFGRRGWSTLTLSLLLPKTTSFRGREGGRRGWWRERGGIRKGLWFESTCVAMDYKPEPAQTLLSRPLKWIRSVKSEYRWICTSTVRTSLFLL